MTYGVTYNHILAVEVALPDGTTVALSADDDGPDLLGLIIGSEGTLAIVTEAADTIAAVIATGVVPAAVEWLDHDGITGCSSSTTPDIRSTPTRSC